MMVIGMRVFYIFSMKSEFRSLYETSPELLFQILKQIYYMHESDARYAFSLVDQLTERIQKNTIDRKLFLELHKRLPYSKSGNQHIMNDLYHDEVSILVVKNSHILLTVNHNSSSFFPYLVEHDHNYFACDFLSSDYFWISSLKSLARKPKTIVE